MCPLKIVFDRSAFHGERFELLNRCPLKTLVSRNKVSVFLTPVFLSETLTAYGSKRPVEWQQHLSFALVVASGGMFLDKLEIWHEELVMGRGRYARFLLPERPSRRYNSRAKLFEQMREIARTGDLQREWVDTKEERDEAFLKSFNQRNISRDIRHEVIGRLDASPSKSDLANYPFSRFLRSEFERTGRHLASLISLQRHHSIADQWAQAPERFPFYSSFVEGFLYNGYYAALEHNERLDRNAQADYEQLAYLNWADVAVSNDTRFFSRAFGAIWKARGKRLETTESFVGLLQRLA